MVTQAFADPEGVLIEQLRKVVGDDAPISAAFDLHAHVKESTVEHLDFLSGYLTNPHEDRERDEQPTAFGVDGTAIALFLRTSASPASA
ncbi:M81 family metallopeptidase [Sinorhizobium fredii]|nr:M81 family metallopeptidase [Sinorhizobium fredii]